MKQILRTTGYFLAALVVIALVTIAFISLPKSSQPASLSPGDLPTATDNYPAPDAAQVEFPPTDVSSYPPPAETQTSLPPTLNPLTPRPPLNWPTDQPWPSFTPTPRPPAPTNSPIFLPTPVFRILDDSVKDDELQILWYPSSPGSYTTLSLEAVLLDANGYRKVQPKAQINLDKEANPSRQQLREFIPSPNGSYAEFSFFEMGSTMMILDLSAGEIIRPNDVKIFFGSFYGWDRTGKHFLAGINEVDGVSIALVDTQMTEFIKIDYEDRDSINAEVVEMSFSSDGVRISDGVLYQPYFGRNNPWLVEIGVRKVEELSNRDVICSVENGKMIFPHSLKWSPDSQKLMWIGGQDLPGQQDTDFWLWMGDVNYKTCDKIALLSKAQTNGFWAPGGYSADWSPDGKMIAFITTDIETGYKLVLLDIATGIRKVLLNSTNEILSNVQFSPDGNLITYSVFKQDHGEIWAVTLDGKDNFVIAGPTPAHAPYKWLKR